MAKLYTYRFVLDRFGLAQTIRAKDLAQAAKEFLSTGAGLDKGESVWLYIAREK